MSFVHPLLLLGALAFAVPLIIHLLNRQRYKRRAWAAMEFLMLAYKKQRRRLRSENLLLLLLRCLIPIVIALAIARPVLRGAIGPALGGAAHHVLVLDHSYSMGLEPQGAQSPFARARSLAGELVDRLQAQSGNRVTLVEAGVRPAMPLVETLDLTGVKAALARDRQLEDGAPSLEAALGQVADMLEDTTEEQTVVYVFTDFQVRAFGSAVAPSDPAADPATDPATGAEPAVPGDPGELFADSARDLLERIDARADLLLVDIGDMALDRGPMRIDNLQVSDLTLGTTLAVVQAPVPVVATVRNLGQSTRPAQVTLDVAGEQPTVRTIEVPPGAESQAEFLVTFPEEGPQYLRATIDGDGLAADDARYLSVQVRRRLQVLLVEGSTEVDPDLMDTGHVWQVLDPERGEGDPAVSLFATKVVDAVALLAGRERLEEYDVIVLGNVERLNEQAASDLARAVEGGSALWVLLGDRVDAPSYNLHLHQSGLMPMELIAAAGYEPGGDRYYTAEVLQPDHPVFREGFVEEFYQRAFELTPVYRTMRTVQLDADRAAVLARLRDDTDRSPLIVAGAYGAGKTLFFTSAISRRPDRWNRLDAPLLAFPLFHESVKWLALPARDPWNVAVGAELSAVVEGRPANVAVVLPERAGGGKVAVAAASEPRPLSGDRYALPAFRGTTHAGIYTMELDLTRSGSTRPERLFFAANPDAEEGDLSYLAHDAARELLGFGRILRGLPTDDSGAVQAGSSDLGLLLLYLALAVVVGEAVLARFISGRRN